MRDGVRAGLARRAADVQRQRERPGATVGIDDALAAGGRIGVRSDEGQGALFWFEWPVTVLAGDAQTQAAQELPADAALQILLIDDNRVNLMVAQLQLKKRWPQAQITAFDNASEALQKLQDLVVLCFRKIFRSYEMNFHLNLCNAVLL